MCEPFAMFPRRLLRAGLSHREQSVMLCLLSYKNNDGEAWPSRTTIATDTGLHISNVHKAVKSLAQKGMIAMNTQSGVRTVYTFPCLDHTTQNLDMVDHAHAPVIAKSATTDTGEGRGQNVTPLATPDAGLTVPKTITIEKPPTADNPSPVEQPGNSGMLPEQPASVPPEAKAAPLPAIVMAENAKPHNVSDEFMQELNARPIVQPKPVDDDLMERARRLAALQAKNSARSCAAKLAERGLLNAGESGQNDSAPESALATATPATPADNLPPVAKTEELAVKTEELAVKTEELAAPVESIAQPEPDAAAPIILPAPVVVHESHDSAPQPALPIICAPQSATPQQGELLPVPPKKKRGGAKTNGHRIPDNWYLTKKLGMWAKEKYGLDDDTIRHETEKFIDHWTASASETAWKSNWDAAWRNWIRKHAESGGTANGNRYNNLPQQKSKTRMAMERLISMSGGDFEIPF